MLFADIPREMFDNIHLPIDEVDYEPGHNIYLQGDLIPYVYTIRSGVVKLVQRLPNGDVRIVRIMGQGDLVGLEGLDGGDLDHDAITMDHVSVCRIPKVTIRELRREAPELHTNLLNRWQKALTSANHWITNLSTGTAKERVTRLLLMLHDTSLDHSFFLPTRDDMGAMLGITTESASKVIAELRRSGVLRLVEKKRACIDHDELQAMTE